MPDALDRPLRQLGMALKGGVSLTDQSCHRSRFRTFAASGLGTRVASGGHPSPLAHKNPPFLSKASSIRVAEGLGSSSYRCSGIHQLLWVTMSTDSFAELFRKATSGSEPYPYQSRFAEADAWPHLLRVPTGAGKTATAILGWHYRRQTSPETTPRRLVYCLPMRVLVEQTQQAATQWFQNLGRNIPVHVLMGGVSTDAWHLNPEHDMLLIGTQDMLLSRALNRGYAASRYHWPIEFALLNNDCLWVYDEPQLMASGVTTSAQLAGLRQALKTCHRVDSLWMSATLEPSWLETVDFRSEAPRTPFELADEDYAPDKPLHLRMTAEKTVQALGETSSTKMDTVAQAILGKSNQEGVHRAGTQTLVVVNTVDRAKSLYGELVKLRKKSATPEILLIHSRFRPAERRLLNAQLQQPSGDRIIVATQVVEAGVDLSSRTLVTELAPWPSLVQRMGRCNRTGHDGPGVVYWVDLKDSTSAPYEKDELELARECLVKLEGASVAPRDLDAFKEREGLTLPFEHRHVLRRRDLLDLFDTTPDLSGNDVDVQRYIRSDEPETDVYLFWRPLDKSPPPASAPAPHVDELCAVSISQARDFFKREAGKPNRSPSYVWDYLEDDWRRVDPNALRPGMTVWVPTTTGGYDWDDATQTGKGWDSGSSATVTDRRPERHQETHEAAGSDNLTVGFPQPLTLDEHTAHVVDELDKLLQDLLNDEDWQTRLRTAALWHDLGKAHPVFQAGLRSANPALQNHTVWAKSGGSGRLKHPRKYFRHELASALAVLQQGLEFEVAYLIAAHHGRVRLAIRALPDEPPPESPDTLFALGIHAGDSLPEVHIRQQSAASVTLDLAPMRMGSASSWTANALELLDQQGPFRLAYLEALIRIADVRASAKERQHE